jgi:hypothetical protein
MHPMFVELFMESDADEQLIEEDRRRRARRVRRNRSVMTVRANTRDRERRPRR